MNWAELVGKKIVAFRGLRTPPVMHRNVELAPAKCPMSYVLFDDNKTYLEFDEQSKYDYHDCDNSARTITLCHNADMWQKLFDKKGGFDEPTDLACPF